MRLPFPESIPIRYAVVFAGLLSAAQLLQGTPASFSLYSFLFIVIATLAFNVAGGFTRPSGGYVFFYAVLAIILGLFWKAFLGEPADSNLRAPLLTMQASVGGVTGMLFAAYVSRKLTPRRAFLENMIRGKDMRSAALGCMIVGVIMSFVLSVIPYSSGSFLSALAQLDRFLPVAMILAVIYQIRKSGGTSSMNAIVWISGGVIFLSGLFGFSKQGMFTPPLCWLAAAASQRYKVSGYQIAGFILLMGSMAYYLVPYSQYGRSFMANNNLNLEKSEIIEANIGTSIHFLSDLGDVRQKYEQMAVAVRSDVDPFYFDTPQGLFDRLQMISMDDALVNLTEQNGSFGFLPVIMDFENLIPHFLWPGKPTVHFGNLYAHELGMLTDEDITTGISFSPIGEAFHLGRWIGIFLVMPALWIMLFTLIDSLCGDVRKSPWGLLAIVLFAHIAPEGGIDGPIYMLGYGAAGIIFAALAAAYVMPVLGSIFAGGGGSVLRRLPATRPPQITER
ncbi:MAG TPA: hypothetical protein VFE38_16760 [Edaphobacter sp.]|nr:hypothetical protein [Edaphobacter sp.]